MRRHGRFRYGPGFARPWRPFRWLWLIGLGMLFLGWRWWPGILVLIGLSIVFGLIFRASAPPQQWMQNPPPPPVPMSPYTTPTAAPVPEQIHRVDLLPVTCPNCGAPIRSREVTWTGKQSAACPYCGSNLPMKKQ